jgi:hypothetical protein
MWHESRLLYTPFGPQKQGALPVQKNAARRQLSPVGRESWQPSSYAKAHLVVKKEMFEADMTQRNDFKNKKID